MAVSPAKALFNWPRAVLIRRQLGLTALFYAVAHLLLYSLDLKWAWWHIASEIVLRFYLTIGLVVLLGLTALGVTSTDGAVRRLGRRWKQLHRLAYPLAALAAFHFFLQSKADVSEATLMAGLLFWLVGWRLLPSGADRAPLPVLGLGVAAAALTAVAEFAWFALGTKIDPVRPLRAELDWSYAPHPAGQILLLGLGMAVATALAWAGQRERLRISLGYQVAMYAGAAAITVALAFAFSLTDSWLPEDWTFLQAAAGFVAAMTALGLARWAWPSARRVLDGVCAACVLAPVVLGLAL